MFAIVHRGISEGGLPAHKVARAKGTATAVEERDEICTGHDQSPRYIRRLYYRQASLAAKHSQGKLYSSQQAGYRTVPRKLQRNFDPSEESTQESITTGHEELRLLPEEGYTNST